MTRVKIVLLSKMFGFIIMGITAFGFDEAIQQLDRMAQGLTEDGINEYCEMVKQEIYKKCGLTENEVLLKATKVTGQDELTFEFKIKDLTKLQCVKESIQSLLSSMPITTRQFFEKMLMKWIDEQLAKIDAS